MQFRCGRDFGRLDNSNGQTLWKLSEWRRTIVFPHGERRGVPCVPSLQTLTCKMNIHQIVTEIPLLVTDNAQFEHVKLTRTTLTLVQCNSENGPRSVGCESCPVEQPMRGITVRLLAQATAMLGKTLAGTETHQSTQRNIEMRLVWFDVELLAEGVAQGSLKSFADFKCLKQNQRRWYSRKR